MRFSIFKDASDANFVFFFVYTNKTFLFSKYPPHSHKKRNNYIN